MNEVYNDVLGKVLNIKSNNNISVKVEQGALEVNLKQCSVKRIMWFSVFLIDGFTMRPCSYTGHSRGLDAALSDTEAKIRKLKTERIYAFNKDGKEIAHSQTGKAHSTQLPFGYNYKDAVITHNHPNRGIGDTIAGRVGTILSGADIFTTIAHNASEIRAVTKNYTYSLKRPSKGWGLSESDAWDIFGKKNSQWRRTLKQKQTEYLSKSGIRNRINEKVLALNRKRSSFTKGGKVPSASEVSSYNREANEIQKRVTEANDRGNVGAQYQVMKEYAKKYGWNLTRKRTS